MMRKDKALRGAKTVFFLIAMTASLLLVCAPQLLVGILDVVLPSVLVAFSVDWPFTLSGVFSQLGDFDFRISIIDLPLVSVARSLLILCVYSVWVGRGPYFGVTLSSNLASIGYVLLKASLVYGHASSMKNRRSFESRQAPLMGALFLSSVALAVAHVVAAYRTSCRERRKMIVYRIDTASLTGIRSEK